MKTETRLIHNATDLTSLVILLKHRKKPFTVSVVDGLPRTNPQNRLQRKWVLEASQQLGDETAEQKRGWCKLHLGVPILRAENEVWAASYDALIKPLPYQLKMAMMMEPISFPVTSKMNTGQKTAYLDAMRVHFEGLGVVLTVPEDA